MVMNKLVDFLVSVKMMAILMVVYALSLATATFIENDFGSEAAKRLIYNARWMEVLYLLIATNLIGNIYRFRLYRPEKLSIMILHIAFLVIILGGAITRYTGFEGNMHIREGQESNMIVSSEMYLRAEATDGTDTVVLSLPVTYSGLISSSFRKKMIIGNETLHIRLGRFIPNAVEQVVESPGGEPVISFYLSVGEEIQRHHLRQGEETGTFGYSFAFIDSVSTHDVTFCLEEDTFYLTATHPLSVSDMRTGERNMCDSGETMILEKGKLYQIGDIRLVAESMYSGAEVRMVAAPPGPEHTGVPAFILHLIKDGQKHEVIIPRSEIPNPVAIPVSIDGIRLSLAFSPEAITVPFSLLLNDFVLVRYPGSNSPSSYESQIVLKDERRNLLKLHKIYMNNVLDYRGYRFYQSAYDPDEKGTILSVSHDRVGTYTSYSGYILLILGAIASLLNKRSYFRSLWQAPVHTGTATMILLLLFSFPSSAGTLPPARTRSITVPIPEKTHARQFGLLLVQDNRGRTKPVNTLTSEIVRKVTRQERFMGYNSDQLFLSMTIYPDYWQEIPLIRISHDKLKEITGIKGKYAPFSGFFDQKAMGTYRLAELVENAYMRKPSERGRLEKEIIRIDERLNIVYYVLSGRFLKLFPAEGDTSHTWHTPADTWKFTKISDDSLLVKTIFNSYCLSLDSAIRTGNYSRADQYLSAITSYQRAKASYDIPSQDHVWLEVIYNRLNIFNKLFSFYLLFGLLLLILHLVCIVFPGRIPSLIFTLFHSILFLGLTVHFAGLVVRWIIAGHVPLSNGYESMIFISWITIVAGFLFVGKSRISLAATSILSGLALMVANMSFMDPEITNLVPVLKSFWLILHVTVITSSYGFLGLGAILGLVNLILFAIMIPDNKKEIDISVAEITRINQKTLIIGLYLLSIGTFLGAVWANESWGRYWGWDPKETWSLITMIVYAFVGHMRLVPGIKSTFAFNLASLAAFGSVLMTYFGVNYYLSGLHSYAGGDPIAIPTFVYISLALLITVAVWAFMNQKRFRTPEGDK